MRVAGIDGTKSGWVVVTLTDGRLDAFPATTMAAALTALADAAAVAIDMPIGFAERAEPGGRQCEREARALLGRRASSVFNSPCREALGALDYADASSRNRASSSFGLGLSKQSYAIFPKMREVDAVIDPSQQDRVFEVHPEVCFAEMARLSDEQISDGKKTLRGAMQRVRLLHSVGLDVEPLLANRRELKAADDDIVDAAVAAWTANRRAEGKAVCLPLSAEVDARGLRMEMWF